MQISRRKSLALIGGGAIVAAAVPAGVFLSTRTPTKALEPWSRAGGYEDARMRALSYALLAPNPHNRQPWEAELLGRNQVALYRDKTRDLPVTDPYGRQLTIGMGCFLELMDMAAAEERIGVTSQLFPTGEDGPVAICTFTPDAGRPDPLFKQTMLRRSHKEMFDARASDAETSAPLREHAGLVLKGEDRDALRQIAHDAWMREATTPAAWKESVDLLRLGKAEINANPDGIDVGGPMLDTLVVLGLLNREDALDIDNPNARRPIEDIAKAILSSPAMTLIRTPENTRFDQIEAGRRWLRLNLAATGAGLAMRPVSQALQEYEEMKPLYEEIHQRFAMNDETIQMLGLLGYGKRTQRTPRWPIESRMRNV
ncbi:MAG: Acg family FMN-binding oxidoreductase [Neomegalonema sp.]